jgi:inhibitor of cysteine peptidase
VKKTRRALAVGLVTLPLVFAGCRSTEGPPEFVYGQADIESVEIQVLGTLPFPIQAIVRGTLADACTKVDSVKQEFRGATLILIFTTRRPIDEVCVQGVTPFEASVPLALEGLQSGVYTVTANGISATFELTPELVVPFQ